MKNFTLLLILFASVPACATIWDVEAGGGPNLGSPYFEPQTLSIAVGDEVVWTWVSGQHNVAATDGPESFNSGSHMTPFTWSFTFTMAGVYEYECSLFNHAATQFGTITVGSVSVTNLFASSNLDIQLFPNPCNDVLIIEKNFALPTDIRIMDITGKVLMTELHVADLRKSVHVANLPTGIYFVEVDANGSIVRKRLLVK